MRRMQMMLIAVLGAAALFAAGCGDDDDGSDEAAKADVAVTEAGDGQFSIQAPSGVEAGVVEFTLDNSANKAPHSAQLIQIGEGHTADEALSIIQSEKPQPIPEWIRGYGGVGETKPGEIGTATVKIDEGHYVLQDDAENGAKPSTTEFDVTGGEAEGELPDTDASVTAATTGEEDPEYEWETDGLVAGENTITFKSEGDEALHHIQAFPLKDGATIEQAQQDLESNGRPQAIDFENAAGTAVIDGEKSEVTTLNLQAGRYVFVCFLPDRDEPDEPHFKQGLLKEITIPQS